MDENIKFSTGFPTLNSLTGGGLSPGTFVAVMGRIGSGKTSFLRRIQHSQFRGRWMAPLYPEIISPLLSQDTLVMWSGSGSVAGYFEEDYPSPIPVERDLLKQLAEIKETVVTGNLVSIFTIQLMNGYLSQCSSEDISSTNTKEWTRCVDLIIRLKDNKAQIVKNRTGSCGEFFIDFADRMAHEREGMGR